jgi:DNA sulfur modification protein DndD
MMKFIELTIKNFMPYKGIQSIKFPQNQSQNILVIFGDNMRGKTSLLNALRWGLYGEIFTRHKARIGLEKILNWESFSEGDYEFSVEIKFEADGHKYDLTRVAKKKNEVLKPKDSNDFEIEIFLKRDGSVMSAHQIEPEINLYAPEQVSRFFLFDGELLQEYEMLLDEGSDTGEAIKDSIEQVLGVPALINGRDECLTLLKGAEKQQNRELAKYKDMTKTAQRQRELQELDDSKGKDIDAAKEHLKKVREDKSRLDDEIEELNKLSVTAFEYSDKQARIKTILSDQKILEEEILQLASIAWKDILKSRLAPTYESVLRDYEIKSQSLSQTGAYKFEVDQIKKVLDLSLCPTCEQNVDSSHKHKYEQRLNELEIELAKSRNNQVEISRLHRQITAIKNLQDTSVSGQISEKTKRKNASAVELTKLENAVDKLRQELAGKEPDEVAKKRRNHDELIKAEANLERTIKELDIDRLKIRKGIEELSKEIEQNPNVKDSMSTRLVSVYKALGEIFSQSIDTLRDRLKEEVEAKASEAFLNLTTQSEYSGLRINNNYGLTILDENHNPILIRSAGAEQIVALSLIDALGRTGRGSGPVVMDTPFGRLDPKHRENILRYIPKTASQLVLLVHDGEINRDVDLKTIAQRIGAEYEIIAKSSRVSNIERLL